MPGDEWPELNKLLLAESTSAKRELQIKGLYVLMLHEDDVWRVPCPSTRALLGVLRRGFGMTLRQLYELKFIADQRNDVAHPFTKTGDLAKLNDMYESTFKPQTRTVQVAHRALEACRLGPNYHQRRLSTARVADVDDRETQT